MQGDGQAKSGGNCKEGIGETGILFLKFFSCCTVKAEGGNF